MSVFQKQMEVTVVYPASLGQLLTQSSAAAVLAVTPLVEEIKVLEEAKCGDF